MAAAEYRRFDLYDFFSVLLPGVAFLLGLYPLAPQQLAVNSVGAILPILTAGFVFGRGLHAAAVRFEDRIGALTHRELFADHIRNSESLNPKMVGSFYAHAQARYPEIGLPQDRTDISDRALEGLYTVVRSHVHIDSRGRSRTFQAVSAFYRSMWFVTVTVGVVYVGYAIVLAFPGATVFGVHLPSFNHPYAPKISPLLISPASYYGIAISLVAAASVTFRRAKANHRQLYVQYLIADFIDLCERSDSGN